MTAVEVLRDTVKLLSKPRAWTQHAFARDKHGRSLHDPKSGSAVSWCFIGAVRRAGDGEPPGQIDTALRAIRAVIGEPFIGCWNDRPGRTHAEVRQAAAQAAELLERKGGTSGRSDDA